jgi:hypothetical protein
VCVVKRLQLGEHGCVCVACHVVHVLLRLRSLPRGARLPLLRSRLLASSVVPAPSGSLPARLS